MYNVEGQMGSMISVVLLYFLEWCVYFKQYTSVPSLPLNDNVFIFRPRHLGLQTIFPSWQGTSSNPSHLYRWCNYLPNQSRASYRPEQTIHCFNSLSTVLEKGRIMWWLSEMENLICRAVFSQISYIYKIICIEWIWQNFLVPCDGLSSASLWQYPL